MKIRVLMSAWLLAMASGAAYALGLGEIFVKSHLNQPLDAEIIVREAVSGEAAQLVAKLASQEDFARVGLERSRMPVTLRFDTAKNDRGQTIIKITSDEPVREPFLTLLIEANWSGGRLLREYAVLLDPAVIAPASTIVRTPPAAPAQPVPPVEQAAPPTPAQTEVAEPKPAPVASAASALAKPAAPPRSAALPPGFAPPPTPRRPSAPPPANNQPTRPKDGRHSVERGDTLFSIANRLATEAGVTTNQMMLALQRANPDAFFADNINALKAGSVLRVPESGAALAVSDVDATTEVRRQLQAWSGSTPALADAGSASSSRVDPAPSAPADPRLQLVPPSADGGSNAAGFSNPEQNETEVAETRVDLQRTREELRSRDQEVSELASRVRDLEALNAKNTRLLELKDAEVAELQRRLAEAGASVDTAANVAVPEPASTNAGTASTTTDSDAVPKSDAAADTIFMTSDDVSQPIDAVADGVESGSTGERSGVADSAIPGEPSDAEQAATTISNTASATTQTPDGQPWYMRPMVQGAAAIGLALLLLLVLLARRQHRQASAAGGSPPRRSVADLFSDIPASAPELPATGLVQGVTGDEDALDLQRQIASDPDNFGAYLELLSLHYAQGDRDAFMSWSERFSDRPGAVLSMEWDQVRSMGEELLPDHSLFATTVDSGDSEFTAFESAGHSSTSNTSAADQPDDDASASLATSDELADEMSERRVIDISATDFTLDEHATSIEDDNSQPLEFSLDDLDAMPVSEPVSVPATSLSEDAGLDTLAPLDFSVDEPVVDVAEPSDEDAAEDDAQDDVATKLELARAYLDMGDPEGARVMLEEVLGEGDTSQREEARKMLATL